MLATIHKAGFWPARSLAIRLSEAEVRDVATMSLRTASPPLNLTAYGVVGACREAAAIWDGQPSPSGERSPLRAAWEARPSWWRQLWHHVRGAV